MDIKRKFEEIRKKVAKRNNTTPTLKLSSGTLEKATLTADFFAKGGVKSISNNDMPSDKWLNYGIPHKIMSKQVKKFLKIAHKDPEKGKRRLKALGFMTHGPAIPSDSRQAVKFVEKIVEKAEQQIANNKIAEKLAQKDNTY